MKTPFVLQFFFEKQKVNVETEFENVNDDVNWWIFGWEEKALYPTLGESLLVSEPNRKTPFRWMVGLIGES